MRKARIKLPRFCAQPKQLEIQKERERERVSPRPAAISHCNAYCRLVGYHEKLFLCVIFQPKLIRLK